MLPHKHELILYIFNKRLYSHRRSFFSASLEFVCVTQPSCQFPVKCTFDSHSTLNKKVHEVFLASFACKVFTKHYSGLVQLAARPSLMASSRPEKLDSEIQMVWLKASDRLFAQSSSMLCLLFPNVFCWFLKDEYIWNLKVSGSVRMNTFLTCLVLRSPEKHAHLVQQKHHNRATGSRALRLFSCNSFVP